MGDAPDEPSFSIPALQRILQLEDIDVPPAPDGTGGVLSSSTEPKLWLVYL